MMAKYVQYTTATGGVELLWPGDMLKRLMDTGMSENAALAEILQKDAPKGHSDVIIKDVASLPAQRHGPGSK